MEDSPARPSILLRLLVFALVCAAVGAAGWWFWQKQSAPASKGPSRKATGPKAVKVAQVTPQNFAVEVTAIGSVRALESTDISANVTETLVSLNFDDGDHVEKGALLAQLSDAEEQAQLSSARAALAEQEREVTRLSGLVKDGAAPAAQLAERETLAELARERIRVVEAQLEDRRIVAPFEGWVGLRRISPGALVSPGTVITSLDQIDTVRIDFNLPETVLRAVKPGTPLSARADAAGTERFTGTLSHLDSRVDAITRSVAARAELPNPDHALLPGMLVTVSVPVAPNAAPALPERAIVPIGTKSYVFTINPTDQAARRLEVRTGRRKPGFVEVLDGVKAGEEVITDGLVGLQPGAIVRVEGRFEKPAPAFNPEIVE
ncbi:MAG: efflux RND transporter periplasmic adaptor subunit [Verrucomicrobiales bacterium]|nr:efflux RND transporter periplasmic adaptor subunit [Verrucomicrobiales bacterium]